MPRGGEVIAMAKRGGSGGGEVDAQLGRLTQIKANPSAPGAAEELSAALRGKNNLLAARAADIVADAKLAALETVLAESFRHFLDNTDRGCMAKTAIARALLAIESRQEEVLLLGARHVQREPSFGGSSDAATQLRCTCCAALVNMRSRKAMGPLVHLLADDDAGARSSAARTLAGHGGDAAEALLQFKLLVGDKDLNVIGDCLAGLLGLTRSADAVTPYLDSPDADLRSAAMLALGESRLPEAYPILRARWDKQFDAESRSVLALAMAVTRRPEAIDFLIEQTAAAGTKVALAAVGALEMYRTDQTVRLRIESAARERGGEILTEFERRFR
jgi:HEAT repeat protein